MDNRKEEFEFSLAGQQDGNLQHQDRRSKRVSVSSLHFFFKVKVVFLF